MPPFTSRPSISRSTSQALRNAIFVSDSDSSLTDIGSSSEHEDLHSPNQGKIGQSDDSSSSGKPSAGVFGAYDSGEFKRQLENDKKDSDDSVDEDSDEDVDDEVD